MEALTFIEGQVDEVEKERNTMIYQLEEKDDDITKLKSKITSLKGQSSESTKMMGEMKMKVVMKDEYCETLK